MPRRHRHGGEDEAFDRSGPSHAADDESLRRGGGAGTPASVAEAEEQAAAAVRRGRAGTAPAGTEPAGVRSGPPWRVAGSVMGSARGADLGLPHPRHTIAGARNGKVSERNTVYLRGYEGAAAQDVEGIAAGRATWVRETQRYEINGRTYGIESNGAIFPEAGTGMVRLDRNEYAALKVIARAGGDLSAAPELSRNPRFTDNPDAVARAKAIYDGTYQP